MERRINDSDLLDTMLINVKIAEILSSEVFTHRSNGSPCEVLSRMESLLNNSNEVDSDKMSMKCNI